MEATEEKTMIGQRIRELRVARSMTQGELARRCGWHLNTIGRYERDELDPPAARIRILAEALGVKPGELF